MSAKSGSFVRCRRPALGHLLRQFRGQENSGWCAKAHPGGPTIRKRQSANKAEQKAWTLHDLLFISSFGKSGERELSFLHFREKSAENKTV